MSGDFEVCPVGTMGRLAALERAEAEWAIERATGQRQLDDARMLMAEAVALFTGYSEHHQNRALAFQTAGDLEQALSSLKKAKVNTLQALRLREWMSGLDRYSTDLSNPAEVLRLVAGTMVDGETIKGVDHPSFDEAAQRLGEAGYSLHDSACRYEAQPIPAEIAENGDLVPTDDKSIGDCRARFETGNFRGFPGVIDASLTGPTTGVMATAFQSASATATVSDQALSSSGVVNVRPVTDGPLSEPLVVQAIVDAAEGDAVAALTLATDTAFRLSTADPRFDPQQDVRVNGFLYHPATENLCKPK